MQEIAPHAEDVPARVVRPPRIDAAVLQQLHQTLARRSHAGFLPAGSKKQQLQIFRRCGRIREQLLPRRLRLDRIRRRLRAQRAEPAAVGQDVAEALGVREADLDALERPHREAADRAMRGIGVDAVAPLHQRDDLIEQIPGEEREIQHPGIAVV